MRNDNKNTVKVGIFVLLGIVILVMGILTLGAQQKAFVKSFRLKAVFEDVAGLQTGNNVWFSGVKIGTVRKIHFYGNSQVEIEMNLEASSKEFIRKDSKATISTDGLIGNKIIVIFGGTTQAAEIEQGDRLETVMPLDTDAMMETLQENNNNLVSITSDLKILTGKIAGGEGIVGAVLTDSLLAERFGSIINNLERTAVNSNRMTSELSKFSSNLNQKGGLIDDLMNDTTVFSSLKGTAKELEETTRQANSAAVNFKDASEKLNSEDNTIGMMLNDPEFAEYLKSTISNLDTGTANFNESLEALRYHWFFRRSFKKKDRAEAKALEQEQ